MKLETVPVVLGRMATGALMGFVIGIFLKNPLAAGRSRFSNPMSI